jgi:hypothetical protein
MGMIFRGVGFMRKWGLGVYVVVWLEGGTYDPSGYFAAWMEGGFWSLSEVQAASL